MSVLPAIDDGARDDHQRAAPRGRVRQPPRALPRPDTGWLGRPTRTAIVCRFRSFASQEFPWKGRQHLQPLALAVCRCKISFGCHKRFESWNIPALLQQLGHQALSAGRVFLRGESVGPRGPLFPSSSLEGIYFALPVYWPDDLSVFKPGADGAIQMSWALPVFPSELDLVRRHGCSQFEDVLSAEDPDLLDLTRGAVV